MFILTASNMRRLRSHLWPLLTMTIKVILSPLSSISHLSGLPGPHTALPWPFQGHRKLEDALLWPSGVKKDCGEVAVSSPLSLDLPGSHFCSMQRMFLWCLPQIGFHIGSETQVLFAAGAPCLSGFSQMPLLCAGLRGRTEPGRAVGAEAFLGTHLLYLFSFL